MNFRDCINQNEFVLMEGALGERLKREYGLTFDEHIAMAGLIYEEKGASALTALWNEYIDIARKNELPFIATTPTRRANRERIAKAKCLETVIADNVAFLKNIQRNCGIQMYVGGLMGCKGDAYTGEGALAEQEAFSFHRWTVEQFYKAGIDFLYAGIMPVLSEAAGLARAINDTGLPYIISFTIQQDGKLIDGTTIADAIRYIDSITTNKPICYMTNCVHPSIVHQALMQPFNRNDMVRERFRGIQANTSPLSYAELDSAEDLYCSEPEEFAEEMIKLQSVADIKIWGGCCGTNCRHMACVARKLIG
ncbi:MAG: homocysteine S-methyltransferase family protein [Lachnospiraceae bacterium]|nr:homocysteine S-methyltransferase family protein [Lachnospiraceae bacterium]